MTNEKAASNVLSERRAEGIVRTLTEQDGTTCVDCGERVDLADAGEEMEVVAALEEHRQNCPGEWYE
jgi:hypothetical protein